MFQSQREERTPVRLQAATLSKYFLDIMAIGATAFLERVDHECKRFQVDLGSCFSSARIEHLFQLLASTGDAIVVWFVTVLFGERQPTNNIRGHEGIALIVFPPAPAAVVMLIGVETIHALLHLLR